MHRDPLPPEPARWICAATYRVPGHLEDAIGLLEGIFGPCDRASIPFPFEYTRYYEPEMGAGLWKVLAGFAGPCDPGYLASAKRSAIAIEDGLRDPVAGGRRVNLDPGLLGPSKLTLASTKEAAHRIYLGEGIYGEVTLLYERGTYRPLPWTYPDYREERVSGFLVGIRGDILGRRADVACRPDAKRG